MKKDVSPPAVRGAIALASICLLALAVPAFAHQTPGGGSGGKPQGGEPGDGSGKCGRSDSQDEQPEDQATEPRRALPHPGEDKGTGKSPCGGDFKRAFLKRVWKFGAEVDSYDEGVLTVTIEKIYKLPKKFKDQDDAILDADADVLVGEKTRVIEDGEVVGASALEDAEHVRVKGRLLRRSKWNEDPDDENERVPTIRAKKIAID